MTRIQLKPALALCAVLAAPAWAAEPPVLSGAQARALLFAVEGRTVDIPESDWLAAEEARVLEVYGADFAYYGAMAVSPGDRADSGSAVALEGYHSPQAAETAALAACEDRRSAGDPCIVIATISPSGYESRALTLSVAASAALQTEYRALDAPKAFAISPSTQAFALVSGDGGEALRDCAARADGANDCRVVVADR